MRTTIRSFYSYIESGAIRVGDDVVEIERDQLFLNGEKHTIKDLPLTFGEKFEYNISLIKDEEDRRIFRIFLSQRSKIIFHYYKHFGFIKVTGDARDLADSVGLLGDFPLGNMYARDGSLMSNFEEFAFEWQVNPIKDDPTLFRENRAPQLPNEKCRMPNESRPARARALRAQKKDVEAATRACADAGQEGKNFDLCVDDIIFTGEVGLAEAW